MLRAHSEKELLNAKVFAQTRTHSHEQSRRHNLVTHFPKDTNCKVCRRSKGTTAPCTRNSDDRADRIKVAERFGDVITADHKILTEEQESRKHHKYAAVVVQDLAAPYSKLLMQNQIRRKSILRKLLRPENQRSICADKCLFFQACDGLNWNRERSTPNKSETCKGNTSKDPFTQCELYKEFAYKIELMITATRIQLMTRSTRQNPMCEVT